MARPPRRRVIGDCGLQGQPDEAGELEIGYGLAEPRAARLRDGAGSALSDWALARPGVRRWSRATCSRRTSPAGGAERAGFVLETDSGSTVRTRARACDVGDTVSRGRSARPPVRRVARGVHLGPPRRGEGAEGRRRHRSGGGGGGAPEAVGRRVGAEPGGAARPKSAQALGRAASKVAAVQARRARGDLRTEQDRLREISSTLVDEAEQALRDAGRSVSDTVGTRLHELVRAVAADEEARGALAAGGCSPSRSSAGSPHSAFPERSRLLHRRRRRPPEQGRRGQGEARRRTRREARRAPVGAPGRGAGGGRGAARGRAGRSPSGDGPTLARAARAARPRVTTPLG